MGDLAWTTAAQVHLGAKACTAADAGGSHTYKQSGTMTIANTIAVTLSPTTLAGADTITATYLRWDTGAVWLCFKSGTSAPTSPACAAAGTATAITAAGSGAGVVCT